jgi:hypothetical protein
MSDLPICSECDLPIEGPIVWFQPFGPIIKRDGDVWQIMSTASAKPLSESSLAYHPACFTELTGHHWPDDAAKV